MSRAKYLRRLFWIGWIAWFFASLVLLRQLPGRENLVLWEAMSNTVNWASEGTQLFVTWNFFIWWAILILIWPLLFRPIQFAKILKLLCRAIPKLAYDLVTTLVFLAILGIWLAGFALLMVPALLALGAWLVGFVLLMVPALLALGAWLDGFVLLIVPALGIVIGSWLILFLLNTILLRWIKPVSNISRAGLDRLRKSIVWVWQEGLALLLPLWKFIVQQWHEGLLNLLPLWRFIVQYWHGMLSFLEPLTNVLSTLGIGTGQVDHELHSKN